MNTIKYIRDQIKNAHGLLEATMSDVSSQHAQWLPAGTALPVGAVYSHMVQSEDTTVNMLLKKGQPLMTTSFLNKTGASELMPMPGEDWSKKHADWAKKVVVDLVAAKEYAQAVYLATDEYIASLTDEDLNKPVDLSMFGMGQVTLAWVIDRFISGHCDNLAGEIAALKGLQGLKGYPF